MKICRECYYQVGHSPDCPVLRGLASAKRDCPDCGGALAAIRLWPSRFLGYAGVYAEPNWLGEASIEGYLHAMRCEKCHAVRWYALPNSAGSGGSPLPIPSASEVAPPKLPVPSEPLQDTGE
jgi:hypothetical protein